MKNKRESDGNELNTDLLRLQASDLLGSWSVYCFGWFKKQYKWLLFCILSMLSVWRRYMLWWVLSLFFVSTCFALLIDEVGKDFPIWDGKAWVGPDSVDIWLIIKEDAIDPKTSASEGIQEGLWIAYENADDQRATFYIKEVINWFLAIVWLIALIVLVYWFYKMFFAQSGEESFTEALEIVKWAAIALFVIWLSWFIVSMLFDIFFAAKEDIM